MLEGQRFTLYLDETGDRGLLNFNPDYPVLCLCGCIVEDRIYRDELIPAVDRFKVNWFGTTQVVLHYSAIMKRSGPYAMLRDPARMYAFEQALAELIQNLPLAVVAASIHKGEYRSRYGTEPPSDPHLPLDLYLLATEFVLERFVGFLEAEHGVAGAVVAEARGRREDHLLREHYSGRLKAGTQFYSAERFSILAPQIQFKGKQDRVAGLELADLMAPPIATRTLRAEPEQSLLWQAVKPKIWRHDDQPGGVGLKTFPNSIGRIILGMSVKGPEGP